MSHACLASVLEIVDPGVRVSKRAAGCAGEIDRGTLNREAPTRFRMDLRPGPPEDSQYPQFPARPVWRLPGTGNLGGPMLAPFCNNLILGPIGNEWFVLATMYFRPGPARLHLRQQWISGPARLETPRNRELRRVPYLPRGPPYQKGCGSITT